MKSSSGDMPTVRIADLYTLRKQLIQGATMLLNRVEKALMNNPVRAGIQRYVEAHQLEKMGGQMPGGVALGRLRNADLQ